ncbi:MAG: hypothetical protein WA624_23215 [Methylocella sp.]
MKKAKLAATWAAYCAITKRSPLFPHKLFFRTSSAPETSAILCLSRFTDIHGTRRKNQQFLVPPDA